MLDVFLDALKDSAIVFAVVLVFNFLISFIEGKLSQKVEKSNRFSPIMGSLVGLIPQCGFSIVATDLYTKSHITMGTLVAVYVACSDEALPIMLSSPDKIIMILPLLLIKFVVGFCFGYLIDLAFHSYRPNKQVHDEHNHEEKHEENEKIDFHKGCCHHSIEENHEEDHGFAKEHILHPLIHSLKILGYVFIVNMIFGTIIYLVGEESFEAFLISQKWITPIYATLIGLIPNCASSVILTQLYIQNSISFGATIAGLCCNAGLGLVFLFKDNKNIKNSFIILGLLIVIALTTGYVTLIIESLI